MQIKRNQVVRLEVSHNTAPRLGMVIVPRHEDHKFKPIHAMNVNEIEGQCVFEGYTSTPAFNKILNLSNAVPAHAVILNMNSERIVNLVFNVCSDDERGKHCI